MRHSLALLLLLVLALGCALDSLSSGNTAPSPADPHSKALEVQTRKVAAGIDVWARDGVPTWMKSKRLGLVTNNTGRTVGGKASVDAIRDMKDVTLVALFGPEHGIRSDVDASVPDSIDPPTGLPVWSLYGKRRKPEPEQLKNVDVLVYDIQDIGARFYTYISTMGNCMEAAAAAGIPFVVLDRPNPIAPAGIGGPLLDAGKESFTAWHRIPVMHGLTVGELASLFVAERIPTLKLHVVRCEGWDPHFYHDQLGMQWINPSPNIRRLEQALLYPGIGLLETTNVSVGRGTDTPFEIVGAPWINAIQLADALRSQPAFAGMTVSPVAFTPTSSTHKGVVCNGVRMSITNRCLADPLTIGAAFGCTLRDLYGKKFAAEKWGRLLGNDASLQSFLAGCATEDLTKSWSIDAHAFEARRAPFLLYPR